jgi:hypothetical protein
MGLPRDDVVFRLWQCDKENHGWREGPPLTVPAKVSGPSPSGKVSSNEKEYCFAAVTASPSLTTLADNLRRSRFCKLPLQR